MVGRSAPITAERDFENSAAPFGTSTKTWASSNNLQAMKA
ncbi:MAG: hypothetical protein Ct9H300mP19_05790 [Dehalococcoidia bacterium]|nr:MAG: hypothetical protein Ct9H300mP19_05790 [Dehalococcoidia bacterium]